MLCDIILTSNPKSKNEMKKKKLSSLSLTLTLFLLQGFFFRETEFHFCQFLSNFLKYSSPKFPSFHSYNIFAIYFPSNFPLLKSLFFTLSNFYFLLNSIFILLSNSTAISFVFSKSFSLSQISYSAVNPFYYTKYFITLFIYFLI